MDNLMVSICSITYNHAPYIQECLDGFLMQKCDFEYEVLIHDDASTDGTAKIIKEYQEKYPHIIKPIFQTENQWSQGIRNIQSRYNFSRAKGKYIALCEGDDYWTDPLKLQKQVDFLEENEEYVLTFHDVKIVNNDQIISPNKIPQKNRRDLSAKEMCGSITIPTLSIVFRNFCNSFIEIMPNVVNGDKALIAFLSEHGKAKYLPFSSGAHYRIHETGVWSVLDRDAKNKNYLNF